MEIVVKETSVRLDKFLADNTEYSRSLIEKMLKGGAVLVNSNMQKGSYKVNIDDLISVDESFQKEVNIEAEDIALDIVYEDDDIIVLNKQSGLVVHPGSGNYSGTLVNALMHHTDDLSDEAGAARAGIVHRLDKDTSGLMLVAKTNKAHEILSDDFKEKRVKREYLALVNGVFPSQSAKINAPVGKSNKDFKKQEVCDNGKEAVTNLQVIERFKKYTLVRLSLETGRTHQIRVHMQYIGYPVFNDPIYSANKATDFGQFLHSTSVDFIHPITKKPMHFEIGLPEEMEKFISDLD